MVGVSGVGYLQVAEPPPDDAGRLPKTRQTMSFRSGGETVDLLKTTTNNISLQELASGGPSAIESFGPEPNGPTVRVEVRGPDGRRFTFFLRCGLFAPAKGGA